MLVGLYSKIHGVAKIVVKIFINLFIGLGLLTGSGGDVAKQPAEQFFMDGDTAFVRSAAASNRWSVGFSKVIITPEDVLTNAKKYYLAGYGNNTNPTEVMDDLYVRTIYMDDNSGRGGVLFAVIDAIGLTNKDVLDIRGRIHDFAAEKNIKSVNVSCTHVHAGIDTMGLWGNMATLTSGRNKAFNETLKTRLWTLWYRRMIIAGSVHCCGVKFIRSTTCSTTIVRRICMTKPSHAFVSARKGRKKTLPTISIWFA
jgi:hypothetical protein